MSTDLIHTGDPRAAPGAASPATATDLLVLAPARQTAASAVDQLPGSSTDDPFERLATAWLLGISAPRTQRAYRLDLTAWATWCAGASVAPLAAQRWHVDAYKTWLTTTPSSRTGRLRAPATIARALSALAEFYSYGVAVGVLAHSPVADVKRPRVSAESQAAGLSAPELRAVLAQAEQHSPRATALVLLLMLTGARIAEVLGADVRDYGASEGHRTLRLVRKGSKRARVVLPAAAVRALETYLAGRTSGPVFLTDDGEKRWGYAHAARLLGRLFTAAGVSTEVTAHSFRHAYATQALGMGVPLQDVQDAMGHADPRTTRRYDRGRGHLDRSPNDRLAAALLG